MTPDAHLHIRLTPGPLRPRVGDACINELSGGPETLLRWLETKLGLPVPPIHNASRITEYAAALDTVTDSVITASMQTDRWATASELLSRRDELLLAGWDEADSDRLPAVVRDLARAAAGRAFVFPSEADRLRHVLDALNAGQALPPHRCALHDVPDAWPVVWRGVLTHLNVVDRPETTPRGSPQSALHTAQRFVRSGDISQIERDSTFRYVQTRSQSAAIELVTAALALAPNKLATTVICCEDDDLALRLDACLMRTGLPTTGASGWSRAHPVLQVLPLTLAPLLGPSRPASNSRFSNASHRADSQESCIASRKCATEEPGLGSSKWEAAIQELCSHENDPEGKLRERLNGWLNSDRVSKGGEIPSRLVRSCCGMVAQWATGRASLLAQDQDTNPELIEALQTAAGQASLLGELGESQGTALSEPQLARLLEEALAKGVEARPFVEAEGGPIRVRSLAEVAAPFDRLIWLGLATHDAPSCRWSTNQLHELRTAGVEVDDGSKALLALRSAEVRGYCYAREAFLAGTAAAGSGQTMAPDLARNSWLAPCPRFGSTPRA